MLATSVTNNTFFFCADVRQLDIYSQQHQHCTASTVDPEGRALTLWSCDERGMQCLELFCAVWTQRVVNVAGRCF